MRSDTMNIYLVISDELEDVVCEDWSVGACHLEAYCIAGQVRARSRGQAKWLAWKNDKSCTGYMCDMPKFSVQLKAKDVTGEPGVLPDSECQDEWWGEEE